MIISQYIPHGSAFEFESTHTKYFDTPGIFIPYAHAVTTAPAPLIRLCRTCALARTLTHHTHTHRTNFSAPHRRFAGAVPTRGRCHLHRIGPGHDDADAVIDRRIAGQPGNALRPRHGLHGHDAAQPLLDGRPLRVRSVLRATECHHLSAR